jgi:uncharacterized protein YegP (UPF0339 family)
MQAIERLQPQKVGFLQTFKNLISKQFLFKLKITHMPTHEMKFVLKTNKKRKPVFSLVAGNGEIIFSTQGYRGGNQAMYDTLDLQQGKTMPAKVVDERK